MKKWFVFLLCAAGLLVGANVFAAAVTRTGEAPRLYQTVHGIVLAVRDDSMVLKEISENDVSSADSEDEEIQLRVVRLEKAARFVDAGDEVKLKVRLVPSGMEHAETVTVLSENNEVDENLLRSLTGAAQGRQ